MRRFVDPLQLPGEPESGVKLLAAERFFPNELSPGLVDPCGAADFVDRS